MGARTVPEWLRILQACGVRSTTAIRWAPVFADTIKADTFSAGDKDLADLLPNILHESSGLQAMEESLSYSADSLVRVFGAHRITPAQAQQVGRISGRQAADQRAIANIVYGGE